MIGAKLRRPVRKAIGVKSTVDVNTFRMPGTTAPPKPGSKKYCWATRQEAISREAVQDIVAEEVASRPGAVKLPSRDGAAAVLDISGGFPLLSDSRLHFTALL